MLEILSSGLSGLSEETIIFGGLTLVSLSLVILVWRLSIKYGNHMSSFMKMNTTAWVQNAKVIQKHSDVLDRFGERIKDSNDRLIESIDHLSCYIKNGNGQTNKKIKKRKTK
jgi:hypothetical protein